MKKHTKLPLPGHGQKRYMPRIGTLYRAITMAAIQRNSAFIDWCRHNRKHLQTLAGTNGPAFRREVHDMSLHFGVALT